MAEISEPQVATLVAFGRTYKLEVTRYAFEEVDGAPNPVEHVCVFIGPNLITQYAEVIR